MISRPMRLNIDREQVLKLFTAGLDAAIEAHTAGAFIHPMEGLGCITVEYHELIEAVHSRKAQPTQKEAVDLAVVAAWLAGSIAVGLDDPKVKP